MPKKEDLHLRLRFIRDSLCLTQEKFAEKANISYKYYQAIETGLKRDLRLSTLRKLSKACNLTLAEFVDERTTKTRVAEIATRYQVTRKTPARKVTARKTTKKVAKKVVKKAAKKVVKKTARKKRK